MFFLIVTVYLLSFHANRGKAYAMFFHYTLLLLKWLTNKEGKKQQADHWADVPLL